MQVPVSAFGSYLIPYEDEDEFKLIAHKYAMPDSVIGHYDVSISPFVYVCMYCICIHLYIDIYICST